jgi:hypothetical protein
MRIKEFDGDVHKRIVQVNSNLNLVKDPGVGLIMMMMTDLSYQYFEYEYE